MTLIRRLVVCAMKSNILFHAVHVPGLLNPLADALSRQDMVKARLLAPTLSEAATQVPPSLLPAAILNLRSWEQLWRQRPE